MTATLEDGNAIPPENVIRDTDNASIDVELVLDGVAWSWATMNFELVLRIEGNPRSPNLPGQDAVLAPVVINHVGVAGQDQYTYNSAVNIPQTSLVVPSGEKAQSYELTLELVGVDTTTGAPFGIAGFVDFGDVMVIDTP